MNTSEFPEIAKAVGHKYLKRVPLAGGGYRYVYHDPKTYSVVGKVTAPTDLISDAAQKIYVNNMVGARRTIHTISGHSTKAQQHSKRKRGAEARKEVQRAENEMKVWREVANRGIKGATGLQSKEKEYLKHYFDGAENVMHQEIKRALRAIQTWR